MATTAYASSTDAVGILDSLTPRESHGIGASPNRPVFHTIQGSVGPGPVAVLDTINLGTLFDTRFRVQKPIPITLDRSEAGVAAVWQEVDEFGHADSAPAATVDLARSLVELYSTLESEQANLGSDLARVWNVLQQHMHRARP